MVGAGLLDYVFVKRLNLQWGISDKAFVLGDEALVPLLRKFAAIPFFVLAAKACHHVMSVACSMEHVHYRPELSGIN